MSKRKEQPMRRIIDGQAALRGLADLFDQADRVSADPGDLAVIVRLVEREIDAGVLAIAEAQPT